MKIRTSIGTGVAAAISATLLTLSSAPVSAARPDAWDVCPAIDSEPLCNLVRHHRAASDRPAAAAVRIQCPGHPIFRVVACGG